MKTRIQWSVIALLSWSIAALAASPIKVQRVASGLSNVIFVTHAPNDFGRVFIVQQSGAIRILSNGSLLPASFLNIAATIVSGGEQGLLGLAFHPNYGTNGKFFVYYTASGSGANTVARYQVSGNPDVATNSGTVLLSIADNEGNHNGGWIAFGPDGYLYIATGDGGGANDQHGVSGNGQNISQLHGKMLRIDVDGSDNIPGNDDDDGVDNDPDTTGGYKSPTDNPFFGPTAGVCTGGVNISMPCNAAADCPGSSCPAGRDEIWAFGLRNPWRDSFDRLTGDLYIADVGQNLWEEVDFQPASSMGGENYGWRCMEGTACTPNGGCTCNAPTLTLPIHTYNHTASRCSITGGYVYRGCAIDGLDGTYFFADYCGGQMYSLVYDGAVVSEFADRTAELKGVCIGGSNAGGRCTASAACRVCVDGTNPGTPCTGDAQCTGGGTCGIAGSCATVTSITSFGEDAYGEIYICDQGGEIFKIIPENSGPDCNGNFQNDSCDILSGFSTDLNSTGIPDECEVAPPPAPLADSTGINKSRCVSLSVPAAGVATGPGALTALRVTLTSLHHPDPPYTGGPTANFSAFEGQVRWVGPPSSFIESTANPTPFLAGVLQCAPYYHDWTTAGLVHVIGREVVPSSLYTVASVGDFCIGNEQNCPVISSGLEIATSRWGDIETPYNPPSETVQPDLGDIAGLVNKFRSAPGAPIKVRAAISGDIPDLSTDIGFNHISACVDAFRGVPYPQAGPLPCP